MPVKFLPAYKWFLKRVKHPRDPVLQVEVDGIYFEEGLDMLNQDGQLHFHLLLAKQLGLKKIDYEWSGMPIVKKKSGRRVFGKLQGSDPQEKRGQGRGGGLKGGVIGSVDQPLRVEVNND